MNKVAKTKWVKALRSGKYQQCDGQLRMTRPDGSLGHCCLGVFCDVLDPDGWGNGGYTNVHNMGSDGLDLDFDTLERYGITDEQQDMLINMNDDDEDFKTIAQYIEENL